MTFATCKRRRTCAQHLQLGLSCLASSSLAVLFAAPPAQACSRAFLSITASYPRAYDPEEVPTNAVLFADGPALTAEDFQLQDAAGNWLPIEVRAVAAGGFDIAPLAELAPNQNYVLGVPEQSGSVGNTISFQTGSGPAQAPKELFIPEWTPTQVTFDFGSCSNEVSFCTGARPQPNTLLEESPLAGWKRRWAARWEMTNA